MKKSAYRRTNSKHWSIDFQPSISYGSEMIVNPSFDVWDGDLPQQNLTYSAPPTSIIQTGENGLPGTGAMTVNVLTGSWSATANILTVGTWYELYGRMSNRIAGSARLQVRVSDLTFPPSGGATRTTAQANTTQVLFGSSGSPPFQYTFAEIGLRPVVLGNDIDLPSGNFYIETTFQTNSSILGLENYSICFRSPDVASGNYWQMMIARGTTNTSWNIYLFRVENYVRTSVFAANFTAINGVVIECSEHKISIFTQSGGVWTLRGEHVSAAYANFSKMNVICSSSIIPESVKIKSI